MGKILKFGGIVGLLGYSTSHKKVMISRCLNFGDKIQGRISVGGCVGEYVANGASLCYSIGSIQRFGFPTSMNSTCSGGAGTDLSFDDILDNLGATYCIGEDSNRERCSCFNMGC